MQNIRKATFINFSELYQEQKKIKKGKEEEFNIWANDNCNVTKSIDEAGWTDDEIEISGTIDNPTVTTRSLGEEGGELEDSLSTTKAIGEEGGGINDDLASTTKAIGEEGGSIEDYYATTKAIGEEGGGINDDLASTTKAIGEEGGSIEDYYATTKAIGEEGGGANYNVNNFEHPDYKQSILEKIQALLKELRE